MDGETTGTRLTMVDSADGTPIGLWRSGSGPALLAVHGTAADHTSWEKVVPLLAGDFTVYAMDRRGRGASGDTPGYAIEREFEDIAAAVDALPDPVYLYGHSFGAACALEAAMRTPRVARLVLYEGGGKPTGVRYIPDELIAELEALIAEGSREEALSRFMVAGAGLSADELATVRASSAWPQRLAALHTIPRELRALNDYWTDFASLREISEPVLVLVGGLTEGRRRETAEAVVAALPDARLAVLPGQRHAAHQVAPELFAATLTEFLLAPTAST